MKKISSPVITDRVVHRAEAEEARSHPGVWFKLLSKDSEPKAWNTATQIRNGTRAAFRPAGSFEAAARGKDVLIRYVGGERHSSSSPSWR